MLQTSESYPVPVAVPPTPSYAIDIQKMLGRSPPRSPDFTVHAIYSKDFPPSPPNNSPIQLRSSSRKSIDGGRRTPSPCPGVRRRTSLHRQQQNKDKDDCSSSKPIVRNKRGDVIPSILRPSRTNSSSSIPSPTTLIRPALKKSLTFDGKIERVVLFERGSLPADITGSEKYEVDDSGDVDAGSVSSSISIPETWTLVGKNLPALTAFGNTPVVLDTIRLDNGKLLVGTVLVRNLAFQKSVSIRYTTDGWTTSGEIVAEYSATVSQHHGEFYGVDRFGFELDLVDDLDLGTATDVKFEFAINYNVAGSSYWDNNGGENYQVQLKRPARMPTRPVPRSAAVPIPSRSYNVNAWDAPSSRRSSRQPKAALPVLPVSPPIGVTSSTPITFPLTADQKREQRRAVSLHKTQSFTDPFERYAIAAEPVPGIAGNSPTGIESPLSSRHSSFGSMPQAPVNRPPSAQRLYADSTDASFPSSLACSPPSTFVLGRA
ncbi:hypothetical protein HDV00_012172 [Rhizophlyctis rosea]|nr:hypothetical protein HDV00_012172 [Rhizophlyctis rosea]